jgi:outer membrane protein assembly factor BamB
MLIRNELGSSNPSLLVKICLQFLVYIPGSNSTNISLRDGTIKCTEWKTNTIYCYTLTGQEIWTFKDDEWLDDSR